MKTDARHLRRLEDILDKPLLEALVVSLFGAQAEEEAGMVNDLNGLISRGIQIESARRVLAAYWLGQEG